MLADDLSLAAATPAGERWMDEFAATEQPRSRDLPPRRVGRCAGPGAGEPQPRCSPANGSERVIEPASRAQLEPAIVAAYALTPREAETLTLLLRGLPTKQIATTLQVTAHTANDHIKSIFDKTGSNSRGELLATIFHGQHRPP